ncbi:MAG: type IV pilin-like G/H family protein [Oscillatoria princeps RMCB-10]|jgi:hypothetical protein|nr:type IV pilin-like G/H family protein [Oscillatoria princeps RMCB-10]
MQVQTNAKLQQSSLNKNESQGFSLKGLLLRILIYSGVLVNLLLPFYDFRENMFLIFQKSIDNSVEARNYIGALNRAQEAYYTEKGYFSDSILLPNPGIMKDRENSGNPKEPENYSYQILSPMVPVQELKEPVKPASAPQSVFMLAKAKNTQDKSYIGVVYTTQKRIKGTETLPHSEICEIDRWIPLPSTLPTIKDGEIQCPPGAHPLR